MMRIQLSTPTRRRRGDCSTSPASLERFALPPLFGPARLPNFTYPAHFFHYMGYRSPVLEININDEFIQLSRVSYRGDIAPGNTASTQKVLSFRLIS